MPPETPGTPTTDRFFTIEEIRKFSAEVTARENERAGRVGTEAGRALIRRSRTVVGKDREILTVSDGDVLDDVLTIEAEAAEAEHRRLARLGAERTTPEKQAGALRKYNADIVRVIEAQAVAADRAALAERVAGLTLDPRFNDHYHRGWEKMRAAVLAALAVPSDPESRCYCGELSVNRVHHETRRHAYHPFLAAPSDAPEKGA